MLHHNLRSVRCAASQSQESSMCCITVSGVWNAPEVHERDVMATLA